MKPLPGRHGLASLVLAFALSGCVGGLLGGGKPVQQYRFGDAPITSPPSMPPENATPMLTLRPIRFAAEVDGNRILTATGRATAYLKDARWVAPAPSLFDAALRAAFRSRASAITLYPAEDGAGAGQSLSVEVSRFEADFAQPGAAPLIRVRASALIEDKRRGTVTSRLFDSDVTASENSVSAVVAAFDTSSNAVIQQIARWTEEVCQRKTSVAIGSGDDVPVAGDTGVKSDRPPAVKHR